MTLERRDRAGRAHESIPHTADVGIRATAPDLAGLFEEAAMAVAEISADTDAALSTEPGRVVESIELEAADLPGLAFAWLNELIGLADVHGPLVRADVMAIESAGDAGWRLRGRGRFGGAAALRLDIKSATYHGLVVERVDGGWHMTAYLDV